MLNTYYKTKYISSYSEDGKNLINDVIKLTKLGDIKWSKHWNNLLQTYCYSAISDIINCEYNLSYDNFSNVIVLQIVDNNNHINYELEQTYFEKLLYELKLLVIKTINDKTLEFFDYKSNYHNNNYYSKDELKLTKQEKAQKQLSSITPLRNSERL